MRPHPESLTGLEVIEQGVGTAFRVGEQLAVRPAPSGPARDAFDHGLTLGNLSCDLAQPRTDGDVRPESGAGSIGDKVRYRERVHRPTVTATTLTVNHVCGNGPSAEKVADGLEGSQEDTAKVPL